MLDAAEKQRLSSLYEQLRIKLLDLSKKNRMLNYGLGARSKRHLQIIDEVLEETYRKLVEEEASLRILPLDEPEDVPREERSEDFIAALEQARVSDIEFLMKLEALGSLGRDDEIALSRLERELRDRVRSQLGLPPRPKKGEINRTEHARSVGIDPNPELQPRISKASHTDQSLQTLKFPDELESITDKISSDARLAEQEMGLSTLFLAFGFLEWYESDESENKAFAPLLLLPVRLEAEKVRGHEVFYLSVREAAAETNLSLQKLLEKNFNRKLPNFEAGEDENADSIESYLERVRTATQGLARWQVHRWLVLGHFAFGRFAMYADLNPDNWKIHPTEHLLVSSILRGVEGTGDGALLPSIPDDYLIDEPEIENIAPLLIQDADASQHSALIDVMQGKNLVIQGPPGTGKSQTITNIIANALAADKTVLFLAEKQAALEVVKRRLTGAGLGDFCLELHSDKASPKLVIESLKQRVELRSNGTRNLNQGSDVAWHENRREIGAYLNALHAEQPDGTTPFQLIWKALRGGSVNADIIDAFKSASLPEEILIDAHARAKIEGDLAIFVDACVTFKKSFGHPADSPWAETSPGNIAGYQGSRLIETLRDVQIVSTEIAAFIENSAVFGVAAIEDMTRLEEVDESLHEPAAPELTPQVAELNLEELERALTWMAELHHLIRALAERSDLSNEKLPKLAVASAILRAGLPIALVESTPAEIYEIANATIRRNTTIIGLIQRFLPILQLFELDRFLPAGTLLPVAVAVQAGAKVMPEHRAWVNAHRDLDPSEFEILKERWSTIATNELGWRRYVARFGNKPWPDPDDIESAATVLRKSGIGKAFATAMGSVKVAHGLMAQFGLPASPEVAEILDGLAEHIRIVRAFEGDAGAANAFGASWKGLSTPFEEIGAGIKLRELFLNRIGGLPNGAEVAKRLVTLAPELFGVLCEAHYIAAAVEFCSTSKEIRSQFDDRSIQEVVAASREEIVAMQRLLAVDPGCSLADIVLPIRDIAEVAEFMAKKESVQRQIEASPVKEAARHLGPTADEVVRAASAVKWVRAVHKANPPRELRMKLLSANAAEERARLRGLAKSGVELRDRYINLISQIATEFGISGLDVLAPRELSKWAEVLIRHADELSDFLAIGRHRALLVEAGLGPFLACADKMRLDQIRLPSVLDTILAERCASRLCTSPELAKQTGATLDARRRQFADRDRRKIANDRTHVMKKLLQRQPLSGSNYGPKKSWTEMALLRNEFSKQKRFTPVRSLLTRAGRSIQALKACFMMSPLSLAKFVGVGTLQFDLLVIDEASQMKPEDALGGMLRVKQIVVVGDQKQLPPTDFFNRSSEMHPDDDFEDIDDESILEGCQKTFREVRRLKWHYRSRCESLIRFSNENFYRDSPLITFPAARPQSFSIDLVRVDGLYQARRNVAESSRVAEEAVEFMRHYAGMDEESIPTLGVVAVNIDQRELIHEQFHRLSAEDPLVEEYQAKVAKKGESFFVKNLENVQGDERDFIFISLTYGREAAATAMKQRFGPINGKQGHRRLNVLFTRARMRIGLFASFGSNDVVPSETSAEGVHVLRRYLAYAEGRGRAPIEGVGADADSDFEIEVADRLRAKGYAVELQVGVSGYRIDLGVRHPDHPERFLAGVECDGARYHQSKSARDRDRLREEVLRGLGWDIVRVWSTDWFGNPSRETEKLVKKLEELRLKPHSTYEDYRSLATVFRSLGVDTLDERRRDADEEAGEVETPKDVSPTQNLSVRTVAEPTPTSEPALSLPEEDEPLTKTQGIQALVEFRENTIRREMLDWEGHRSILRDAMIETFVSQHFTDPDEWFTKVPTYLRQGTNPFEKNKYLERICEIVSRIDSWIHSRPSAATAEDFRLTSPEQRANAVQGKLPLGVGAKTSASTIHDTASLRQYIATDFAASGLRPDASRFYEASYRSILRQMIAQVVSSEAPIYEDVLVERIARAHGFQRSGNNIYQIVTRVIDREFARSKDDDRVVIWPTGMRSNAPWPFRESSNGVRSHSDIPIAELASLATPFIRLRMSDEDVLRRMADHFQLGRLREATRGRFEDALKLAHQHL